MTSVKATLLTADSGCDVTRRFLADPDVISCHAGLVAKISHVFPGLTPDQFSTYWRDDEGDLILMSRDEEVQMALTSAAPQDTFKIFIKDAGNAALLHPGVICDVCNGAIYGRRYKCAVCRDYDLCATCEQKGNHSTHPMVRIATPMQQVPGFCRTGTGAHPRFCSRFPRGTTGFGPFGVSPHFFFGHCQPSSGSCQNMRRMAETIMKNWAEAMHPGQHTKKEDNSADKKGETTPEDGGAFDPAAFSAMMEEVSENFCEALKTIGAKRRAGTEEDGPKEKQGRCAEGSAEGCSGAAFDFRKMEEMISPLIKDFLGCQYQKPECRKRRDQTEAASDADEVNQTETEVEDEKEEPMESPVAEFDFRHMEEMMKPLVRSFLEGFGTSRGMGGQQKAENKCTEEDTTQESSNQSEQSPAGLLPTQENLPDDGSKTSYVGASYAEDASHQGAAAEGLAGPRSDQFQAAENFQQMMSGMLQQFGIHSHTGNSSADPAPSTSTTLKEGDCPNKGEDSNNGDSATFEFVNPDISTGLAAGANDDKTANSDAARVTHSLAQLTSMGFKDENGWLTRLLEEKAGDVGRVLDIILPSRK